MTSFIGREPEIESVRALFGSARMVTLLGPGGVGKTRIAVRAAASLADQFRGGVRMVELAGVHDGELIPYTVGAAFGLPEGNGRSPLDMVVEFLRDEQTLLVLDTCEHLVDACAMFAEILLSSCRDLRLLLTSRQALDVPAEHAVPVAPLRVPATAVAGDIERYDAVKLFVERAAAASPGFAVTPDNREQIVAVCRRLDGIPLALELAAVRLRALPLDQVLRRLENRFRGLGGGRAAQLRHHTLRTTIDWSHDLCTPEEQTLWARLSVFAGGFDLEAAEQVCVDGDLDAYDIVDHLIGLVDKSVVVRQENTSGDSGDRYRMLDTIREYGAERLAESGEARQFVACHRDYYLRLARESYTAWAGADQVAWTHRLDREIDNFRAVFESSFNVPGEEAAAVALAGALQGLWIGRSRLSEGRRWCERAIATGCGDDAERSRVLWQSAYCTGIQGDMAAAVPVVQQAIEAADRAGDRRSRALGLVALAGAYIYLNRKEDARLLSEEAIALAEELGEPLLLSWAYRDLGMHYIWAGDLTRAEHELHHAVEVLPDGECWQSGTARLLLAFTRLLSGDHDAAQHYSRRGLRDLASLPERFGTGNCLAVLSWCATEDGRFADAAVLLGGAQAVARGVCSLFQGDATLLALLNGNKERIAQALGQAEGKRLEAEGEVFGLARVVSFALGEPVDPLPDADTPPGPSLEALTRREREVAALVHRGMSNREISEQLVISKRTADAHVEHILAKLGFASRGEIAALVGADKTGLPR
ncbi:MAG TPA: LuxR C-terminal-related transcriptional regulator [Streptomyces sp.]|nr:LuxR C-terminal-related transcriptional regulator [Streptomyces sp.]